MTTPRTGFVYLDEPADAGAVVALAHRGGAPRPELEGLENTMKAFESAVALGYRYLETDAHLSADGEVLAFHDEDLARVTQRPGRLGDVTYADMSGYLVGGAEPIPRLADLVEACPGARFNVDLKSVATAEPIVALIERMGLHDRICIGSFTERALRGFRRRMAAVGSRPVATSCGVTASTTLKFAPALFRAVPLLRDTGAVLQVPHHHRGVRIVDRRFVERAHAAGRHVHVWTVNDRAEMEELVDLGVDGVITDRTDVLRDVLERRGRWFG